MRSMHCRKLFFFVTPSTWYGNSDRRSCVNNFTGTCFNMHVYTDCSHMTLKTKIRVQSQMTDGFEGGEGAISLKPEMKWIDVV